jgi:hypothetical protein
MQISIEDRKRFIHQLNVGHLRDLLQTITDEAERQTIQRLLDEEQKKLSKAETENEMI